MRTGKMSEKKNDVPVLCHRKENMGKQKCSQRRPAPCISIFDGFGNISETVRKLQHDKTGKYSQYRHNTIKRYGYSCISYRGKHRLPAFISKKAMCKFTHCYFSAFLVPLISKHLKQCTPYSLNSLRKRKIHKKQYQLLPIPKRSDFFSC